MSSKTERSTLHFDLTGFTQDREFTLLAGGGRKVPLKRYADHPSKMNEHRRKNLALAMIPDENLHRLTHFCEDVELSASKTSMRRVVFPSLDHHPLPEIAMAFMHTPRSHVMAAHARFFRKTRRTPLPHALSAYGVSQEQYHSLVVSAASGIAHQVHYDATLIQPPGVTAQSIVLSHPELGSVSPGVMEFLKTEYLNPATNPDMSDLVQYIQDSLAGEGPYCWYNKSWVMWSENEDGSGQLVPAQVNTDIQYQNGETVTDWPIADGTNYQGMPCYNLTDEFDPPNGNPNNPSVIEASTPVVNSTLLATKNDESLNGVLWTKQSGVTNISSTSVSAPTTQARSQKRVTSESRFATEHSHLAATSKVATAAGSAKGFTLKSMTSNYGLEVHDLSFNIVNQTLTIPLKNWPSRYLGAYIQFQKEDGSVILRKDIPNWPDNLPLDFVKVIFQPSDSKNYLDWLSSGNAVFGVPVPPLSQVNNLSFPWPQAATRASLLLGGLGCASGFKDWDTDVDLVGVLGTGLINYGTGTIMLVADVYFVNPFISGLKGDAKIAFYAIAGVIGASALVVGIGEKDNWVGKYILSKLAGIGASAIFGAVTERLIAAGAKAFLKAFFDLSAEFMAELTAEEALEAVPVAGWALRVASVAADIAALASTTVECLLSPATYSFELLHTMNLTVTVSPDPTHGKEGYKPVWPAVAEHYVIQVKYPSSGNEKGGTTYTLAGPMPGEQDQPIVGTFSGIPAGGKIDVVANIYSSTDWLAGTWDSGWVDATPDANDCLAVSGAIVELLVPLTPNTTYAHKQTLAFSNTAQHYWQVASFGIDASLVPDFDKGGAPDASIQAAFATNGNTLDPTARITVITPMQSWTLTDSQAGTTFAVKAKQISIVQVFELSLSTYEKILNAGGTTPASIISAFADNNYPLPANTAITVVTLNEQWTIALPGCLPLFELNADGSNIDVMQTNYELTVQNIAQPAPPLPGIYPLSTNPTGNALGALQNIIINDKEFCLGYAYLASGQNMPIDNNPGVTNIPMYAMQSISTLGQPQTQIITPTKGFSLPTFLAYDQFGLTPLFSIALSFASELTNGPVPADLVTEFGKYGYVIPPGSCVSVVTQNKDWTIGLPTAVPDFELRVTTNQVNGVAVQQIGVYSFPIPAQDNFFLEPQPAIPNQPLNFYLRSVALDQPPGEYSFNYSNPSDPNIWGIFQNATPFQELAVHPNGYVVGLDNTNAKMFVLKLPANSVLPNQAPLAMPLAGMGGREGLLDSPQAMTIAADGRVLILETGTHYIKHPRIQAFDIMGNPVQCFSVNQPSFLITTGAETIITELNQQQVSLTLLQLFQQNIQPALAAKTVLFDSLSEVAADLDGLLVDMILLSALQSAGLAASNATSSDFTVTVTTPGSRWFVTDKISTAQFDIRLGEDPDTGFNVLEVYLQFSMSVDVRSQGIDWKLSDSVNAMTFEITKDLDSSALTVQQLCSWMPLRPQQVQGTLAYLDIATETKGYIYVLGVINNNYNSSKNPNDLTFQLDIYNPDGSVLLTEPQDGLNAGKITVDQYRSLFSLNYNVVIGPNSRTEPGVSQWIPSTPTPAS